MIRTLQTTWALLLATRLLSSAPQQTAPGVQELYEKGALAMRDKDFVTAEQAYQAGLQAAESAGDKAWIAQLLQCLAETHEGRQQWKEAIAQNTRALSLYEELGRRPAVTAVLVRLGTDWVNLSNYTKSVEYLERAQAAFLEAADNLNAAKVLDLLGQVQGRIPNFDAAEKALAQALSLYQKANDPKGEAKVRGSLADLDRRNSRFSTALENGFRAFDADERFGEHREAAKVLDVLGNAFQQMGQPDNALRYYQRALEVRQKFALKQDLPYSYRNIGASLAESGKHAEALEYYQKSLELGKAAANAREVADNKLNLGRSEMILGQMEKARQDLNEALTTAEHNGYRQQAGDALYNLGNLAQATSDLEHAREFHQRALKVREENRDRRGIVRSLNRLGLVLEDLDDLKGAQQVHERALTQFEAIGAGISDPVQYGAFRRTSIVLYPHYARVLVKLGKAWDALLVSERSRAVGLSRMAALNGASFFDLLGPENAKAWQSAGAELARADNGLRLTEERVRVPGGLPGDDGIRSLETARARFYEAQKNLSDLRDRFFTSTPELREAQNPSPPNVAQLEAMTKSSPDTLFLEWMMVDDKSALLFALHAGGLEAFELNHGTDEFLSVSNAWRVHLTSSRERRNAAAQRAASSEEAELAKHMYDLVFSRLDPLLAAGKFERLVVVSEGPLLDIPFSALMNGKSDRLIDRYALSNTVSFSRLLQQSIRRKPVRSMLAVADPLAAGEHRTVVPSGYRYDQLLEAREEGKTVAAMYADSVLLVGPSAREMQVKRLLPEFEFLHFATHGILDARDGMRSGLLLATEPADSPEDGVLHAWEVAELSLSARLVVLSACDTSLGKERLGDGLLGMAWAFLAGGAPRVVASLWSVDDAATRELITGFYREINRGTRLDEAMRRSMLEMRKNPRLASPYHWSAFQILGQAGTL